VAFKDKQIHIRFSLIENEMLCSWGKAGETLETSQGLLRPGSGQLMILIGSVASQPLNFHMQDPGLMHVDKSQASDNGHQIMFCM
jgi:hypothetical protein